MNALTTEDLDYLLALLAAEDDACESQHLTHDAPDDLAERLRALRMDAEGAEGDRHIANQDKRRAWPMARNE